MYIVCVPPYVMNSFACLCPGVLFQYEALVLAFQAEILVRFNRILSPKLV